MLNSGKTIAEHEEPGCPNLKNQLLKLPPQRRSHQVPVMILIIFGTVLDQPNLLHPADCGILWPGNALRRKLMNPNLSEPGLVLE